MNAERLHAIAGALHKEMVATQTVGQIEALCSSLQQVGFETPQIVTPLEPFKEKDEL